MSIEIGNRKKDWHDSLMMVGVDISAAASNEIVAAVAGTKVRVYRIWLRVDAANDVTFTYNSGTALDGVGSVDYGSSGEIVYDDSSGQFPILFPEGQNMEITLSQAQKISGFIWYAQF